MPFSSTRCIRRWKSGILFPVSRSRRGGSNRRRQSGETSESKLGYPCVADLSYDAARAEDFDGVIAPVASRPTSFADTPRASTSSARFTHRESLWPPSAMVPGSCVGRRAQRQTRHFFFAIKDDVVNAGASGKIRKSWSTATSSPRASPTICPRSASPASKSPRVNVRIRRITRYQTIAILISSTPTRTARNPVINLVHLERDEQSGADDGDVLRPVLSQQQAGTFGQEIAA